MRRLLVVLGVPIDNLTMEEALERLETFVERGRQTGKSHQVATVNADFVVKSLQDPELRLLLQEADMATDGFSEAWNAQQELYGYERLLALVEENTASPASEIGHRLYQAVETFSSVQSDDQTLLVVKGTEKQ